MSPLRFICGGQAGFAINQGSMPDLSAPAGDSDFYFVPAEDPETALSPSPRFLRTIELRDRCPPIFVAEKVPGIFSGDHFTPADVGPVETVFERRLAMRTIGLSVAMGSRAVRFLRAGRKRATTADDILLRGARWTRLSVCGANRRRAHRFRRAVRRAKARPRPRSVPGQVLCLRPRPCHAGLQGALHGP